MMVITKEYSEAAVETLGILDTLQDEDRNKIPKKIIDFLENNKSESYNPNIDYYLPNEELILKDKTREILAGIYLDYLCPKHEKEEYENRIKKNYIEYQEKIKDKYNSENMFKNRNISYNNESNQIAIIKEEKFFTKVIKRIKEIFK